MNLSIEQVKLFEIYHQLIGLDALINAHLLVMPDDEERPTQNQNRISYFSTVNNTSSK